MKRNSTLSMIAGVALLVVGYWLLGDDLFQGNQSPSGSGDYSQSTSGTIDPKLAEAIEKRRSSVWVSGSGTVERVLSDDTNPPRHQRFIIRLSTGQTLLVAHNIDLAPRVADLMVGTDITFRGEYEWNDRGGVIHWTHHDPRGRKAGGWLDYRGRKYQ